MNFRRIPWQKKRTELDLPSAKKSLCYRFKRFRPIER